MIAEKENPARKPGWLSIRFFLIPLAALGILILVFTLTNPMALFRGNLPPVETLSFERIRVTQSGFTATLINSGPAPVTIAQVMVDDAYWQFHVSPEPTISRFEKATLTIPYQWVANEPHHIRVVTSTGLTFDGLVEVATLTPTPGRREFMAYGLLGIYIGVIPVGLGLLWYPAMKRMGRRWLGAILALTVGLLIFLLIDTFLEALEVGGQLPGAFQGVPLALFCALLTWLVILTISSRQGAGTNRAQGMKLAYLIALSIGLHNFGEGLAVGAAFSLGQAALGSFLVIGFILHNITEGIGIAAPLVPSRAANQPVENAAAPSLAILVGLAVLAGAPAILGAWIGGFAFSPLLATVFLGIGLGAIWQVIVEVVGLLRRYAQRDGTTWASGLNLAGFVVGLAIMYFTAFLVKF